MNVGMRIKELREMRGITVNKLANLAGLSQSYLREIELGNKNPTVESLSYFCDALGVSLAEFFNDSPTAIVPALATEIARLSEEQQLSLAEFLHKVK
ncbi:MAG: helix-turn-helix transcriptional regulator [Ruminococcus sp.]|nr:helix-turn-helix transcriptional regulator [Ruminococcus sp.]